MEVLYDIQGVEYKNILSIKSLKIFSNKITVVTGSSGSGKTTFLKLFNKLISPNKGNILYKGIPLKKLDSVKLRREVIMTPQFPVIFPGDIKENIIIGLKLTKENIPQDEELLKVLDLVELNKSLYDDPTPLSGGEKKRLSLARALIMNPKVLLLDEPTSSLDEETALSVWKNLIQYVKDNKKSLIAVTHLKQATKSADVVITIENGRITSYEINRP